jgi:NhaA family Na+:H+ antiporter
MIRFIQRFIQQEYTSGMILVGAAILAMIAVNSSFDTRYIHFLNTTISFHVGNVTLQKTILHWINDGLMAIFFLLVGIEIKRELVEGELNTVAKATLPVVAAIGGMIIPSVIFMLLNWRDPIAIHGWAIPSATDIAFALAVLAIFSSRIPFALKIFLTALAILDDLGAIIIIAVFYTSSLSWFSLSLGGLCIAALIMLNRRNVTSFIPYAFLGFILWLCVLQSGVHATLAGVILALTYPLRDTKNPKIALSHEVESTLMPWVNYVILPLFAFANAGVPLKGMQISTLSNTVPLGIILGLFLGKQLGVFGACWLAIRCKIATLPSEVTWRQMYAVAILCGIGFTMSLFIGTLAYEGHGLQYAEFVRIGVLIGSLLSVLLGSLFILLFCKKIKK